MHARTLPTLARIPGLLAVLAGALLLVALSPGAEAAPVPTTATHVDTVPTGAEVRLLRAVAWTPSRVRRAPAVPHDSRRTGCRTYLRASCLSAC